MILRSLLDIPPGESETLTCLVHRPWQSWSFEDISPAEIGDGYRASEINIVLDTTVISIHCLAVELPNDNESFRLKFGIAGDVDGKTGERLNTRLTTNKVDYDSFDVGARPKLFLVWRSDDYSNQTNWPDCELLVESADALLIKGRNVQVVVQPHPLPTWLSVTHDLESINDVLRRAIKMELLT